MAARRGCAVFGLTAPLFCAFRLQSRGGLLCLAAAVAPLSGPRASSPGAEAALAALSDALCAPLGSAAVHSASDARLYVLAGALPHSPLLLLRRAVGWAPAGVMPLAGGSGAAALQEQVVVSVAEALKGHKDATEAELPDLICTLLQAEGLGLRALGALWRRLVSSRALRRAAMMEMVARALRRAAAAAAAARLLAALGGEAGDLAEVLGPPLGAGEAVRACADDGWRDAVRELAVTYRMEATPEERDCEDAVGEGAGALLERLAALSERPPKHSGAAAVRQLHLPGAVPAADWFVRAAQVEDDLAALPRLLEHALAAAAAGGDRAGQVQAASQAAAVRRLACGRRLLRDAAAPSENAEAAAARGAGTCPGPRGTRCCRARLVAAWHACAALGAEARCRPREGPGLLHEAVLLGQHALRSTPPPPRGPDPAEGDRLFLARLLEGLAAALLHRAAAEGAAPDAAAAAAPARAALVLLDGQLQSGALSEEHAAQLQGRCLAAQLRSAAAAGCPGLALSAGRRLRALPPLHIAPCNPVADTAVLALREGDPARGAPPPAMEVPVRRALLSACELRAAVVVVPEAGSARSALVRVHGARDWARRGCLGEACLPRELEPFRVQGASWAQGEGGGVLELRVTGAPVVCEDCPPDAALVEALEELIAAEVRSRGAPELITPSAASSRPAPRSARSFDPVRLYDVALKTAAARIADEGALPAAARRRVRAAAAQLRRDHSRLACRDWAGRWHAAARAALERAAPADPLQLPTPRHTGFIKPAEVAAAASRVNPCGMSRYLPPLGAAKRSTAQVRTAAARTLDALELPELAQPPQPGGEGGAGSSGDGDKSTAESSPAQPAADDGDPLALNAAALGALSRGDLEGGARALARAREAARTPPQESDSDLESEDGHRKKRAEVERARAVTRSNMVCLLKLQKQLPQALAACESVVSAGLAAGAADPVALLNYCALLVSALRPEEAVVPAEQAVHALEAELRGKPPGKPVPASRARLYCCALHNYASARAAAAAAVRERGGTEEADAADVAAREALVRAQRTAAKLLGPTDPIAVSAADLLVGALAAAPAARRLRRRPPRPAASRPTLIAV
eukprot:TRINITY_DN8889_c5_g1_i1.p1 TRINITY_DN8889_c5_g1~~TRINITY_DN8889_c5_g1_i1.p1  ORF type:complete len:1259 (+),score=405.90 TRINITY_DN8889_c5_g1_i1:482-3778(+)